MTSDLLDSQPNWQIVMAIDIEGEPQDHTTDKSGFRTTWGPEADSLQNKVLELQRKVHKLLMFCGMDPKMLTYSVCDVEAQSINKFGLLGRLSAKYLRFKC